MPQSGESCSVFVTVIILTQGHPYYGNLGHPASVPSTEAGRTTEPLLVALKVVSELLVAGAVSHLEPEGPLWHVLNNDAEFFLSWLHGYRAHGAASSEYNSAAVHFVRWLGA